MGPVALLVSNHVSLKHGAKMVELNAWQLHLLAITIYQQSHWGLVIFVQDLLQCWASETRHGASSSPVD